MILFTFLAIFAIFATFLREIATLQLFSCEELAPALQNSSVSLIELANSSCVYEIKDLSLAIDREIQLKSLETTGNSVKLTNSSLVFNKNTSFSKINVAISTGSQENGLIFLNSGEVALQVPIN